MRIRSFLLALPMLLGQGFRRMNVGSRVNVYLSLRRLLRFHPQPDSLVRLQDLDYLDGAGAFSGSLFSLISFVISSISFVVASNCCLFSCSNSFMHSSGPVTIRYATQATYLRTHMPFVVSITPSFPFFCFLASFSPLRVCIILSKSSLRPFFSSAQEAAAPSGGILEAALTSLNCSSYSAGIFLGTAALPESLLLWVVVLLSAARETAAIPVLRNADTSAGTRIRRVKTFP